MSKRASNLICVAALTVFSVGRASAVDLTPVETDTVGTNPVAIATGDFDKDGFLDMVVANWGSANISVLLNKANSNAKFKVPDTYIVGTNPHAIAVGDFNADTFLDLAVANQGGTVSILLNNPLNPGHFKPKTDIPAGDQPLSIAVGDFDADGVKDLAVVNQGTGVSILMGKPTGGPANGTFKAPDFIPLPGGHTVAVVVGDFKGVAGQDLAVVDSAGNVYMLIGKGNGKFKPEQIINVTPLPRPYAIVADDLDADGNTDLVVTDYSSQVFVFIGKNNGSLKPPVAYPVGSVPNSVAVGDFDANGKKDIVVANSYSGTLTTWHGVGNGTFFNPETTMTGILSGFVAAGDFRNAGFSHSDVAVALFMFNQVSILKGQ